MEFFIKSIVIILLFVITDLLENLYHIFIILISHTFIIYL